MSHALSNMMAFLRCSLSFSLGRNVLMRTPPFPCGNARAKTMKQIISLAIWLGDSRSPTQCRGHNMAADVEFQSGLCRFFFCFVRFNSWRPSSFFVHECGGKCTTKRKHRQSHGISYAPRLQFPKAMNHKCYKWALACIRWRDGREWLPLYA